MTTNRVKNKKIHKVNEEIRCKVKRKKKVQWDELLLIETMMTRLITEPVQLYHQSLHFSPPEKASYFPQNKMEQISENTSYL